MKIFPASSLRKILMPALVVGVLTIAFFGYHKISSVRMVIDNEVPAPEVVTSATPEQEMRLLLAGWLPYWSAQAGRDSLTEHETLFDEIRLFAVDVANDGTLVDRLGLDSPLWRDFLSHQKTVYPTLLWTDAPSMHRIFTDPELRKAHIRRIITFLTDHNFPSVDIDYEGKDVADREAFSAFLEELKGELNPLGKKLSCTIEARTDDTPPPGWTGVQSMSYANDFLILDRFCDTVSLMAYDEVFQIHRANTFETLDEEPSAPQADRRWVESVIQYALRSIAPEKIMLGVPTYGWEFQLTPMSTGYRYTRIRSMSYPDIMERASQDHALLRRTEGGEPSFLLGSKRDHLVTFSDATSIKEKIELAKKYKLRGVVFFKLDGLSDPSLFPLLEAEKKQFP